MDPGQAVTWTRWRRRPIAWFLFGLALTVVQGWLGRRRKRSQPSCVCDHTGGVGAQRQSNCTEGAVEPAAESGPNSSPGLQALIPPNKTAVADGVAQAVLVFWFEGSLQGLYQTKWFPSNNQRDATDKAIGEKFGKVLEAAENGQLTGTWSAGTQSLLALVVVLDQFSRHIYRHHPERDAKVGHCDKMALTLAETAVSQGLHWELTPAQLVFLLMPLRHSPTKDRLETVQAQVDERAERLRQEGELLQKFRRTTQRRLLELQGRAPEGGDILEHLPFQADETDMGSHKLVRTIADFLQAKRAQGVLDAAVVSLSGGVDSMVLCKILKHLQPLIGYREVVGVHIDYANRHESGREADFVESWCKEMGVAFRKRVVSEVTRGVTERDQYEKEARAARYETYQQVLEECGCGNTGVMFGHHRGDVQENVISNTMKGCSLLNLSGMGREGVVNGVAVWRPMLPHDKDVILDFAHKYGVPYFKDTTPLWSTRGKLRTRLMPLLEEMYGSGYPHNLSAMAEESDQLRAMTDAQIFAPVRASVRKHPMGLAFDVVPHRGQGLFFWKEVMRELCHGMGLPMVREKALGMMRRHMGAPTDPPPKDGWWELRREYRTYCEGGRLLIFNQDVFPPQAPGQQLVGTPVGLNTPFIAGPWRITVTEEGTVSAEEARACTKGRLPGLTDPPFRSVEEFMSGNMAYKLAVPDEGDAQLEIQTSPKLHAWTRTDPRVKVAVPLVAASLETEWCGAGRLLKVAYQYQLSQRGKEPRQH